MGDAGRWAVKQKYNIVVVTVWAEITDGWEVVTW